MHVYYIKIIMCSAKCNFCMYILSLIAGKMPTVTARQVKITGDEMVK